MNASDPFEILRTHVRSTTVGEPPRISDAELVDAITNDRYAPTAITSGADFEPRRQPRRSHRRVAVGVAVALAASGGLAVAASNWGEEASRPERGASCYSQFSTKSSQLLLANSVDPLTDCATMWESGRLTSTDPSIPAGLVPPLVACVRDDVVAVFPSTDDRGCGSLGLPDAIVADEVNPVAALAHRLVDDVNAKCLPFEAAQQETEKILHSLRLSGWKIVDSGGTGACSYASANGAERVVTLSLLPPFPPVTN
jgi:hypothetical protein